MNKMIKINLMPSKLMLRNYQNIFHLNICSFPTINKIQNFITMTLDNVQNKILYLKILI